MAARQRQELAFAGFFVSHTLVDAGYCRQLILPAIEALVDRKFNQYVFMDYENFGRGHKSDSSNAHLFANAYARDIERLLKQSQALFLVASQSATCSQWVKYEVDWWVQNRPLEELTVIVREACDPILLNPSLAQCLQLPIYDPENPSDAAILRGRIGSFISR